MFASRLGNLVLLKKRENESLGNGGFQKKKAVLALSSLCLTKEVSNQQDWTDKEIKARQSRLAQMAVSVWPLR